MVSYYPIGACIAQFLFAGATKQVSVDLKPTITVDHLLVGLEKEKMVRRKAKAKRTPMKRAPT